MLKMFKHNTARIRAARNKQPIDRALRKLNFCLATSRHPHTQQLDGQVAVLTFLLGRQGGRQGRVTHDHLFDQCLMSI